MRVRDPSELVASREAWLGDVPAGWTSKPLRSMYRRTKDVDHPDEQMLSVFREYGVVAKESRDNINQTAEDRSIYQLVHPRWLVANRMKAWQGSVGISSYRGIVSGHYICFAPTHGEDDRYLNWLFRSGVYAQGYGLISRGVRIGQAEIDNVMYGAMSVLLPPLVEQRNIADFLDRETAQIDVLIAKNLQLIETLRQRRESLRRQVPTRGVRETHLKPSYLPWAAEVPLDWAVVPLTSVARMESGHTPSRSREDWWRDCHIPWVSLHDVGKMRSVRYLTATAQTISNEGMANSSARLLPAGTVVLSRDATVGRTAIMSVPMATSQHFAAWICGPRLLAEYLWLIFDGAMQVHFDSFQNGSTIRTIGMGDLRKFRIPLPPLNEQRHIVDHLDQRSGKIDSLIEKAQQLIFLAKERRSALITAAVTGQIDVRGVA